MKEGEEEEEEEQQQQQQPCEGGAKKHEGKHMRTSPWQGATVGGMDVAGKHVPTLGPREVPFEMPGRGKEDGGEGVVRRGCTRRGEGRRQNQQDGGGGMCMKRSRDR